MDGDGIARAPLWPWLDDAAFPEGATDLEITLWHQRLLGGAFDCTLSQEAFTAIMMRAARARLPVVTSASFKQYCVRDVVLEDEGESGAGARGVRVRRERLVACTEADGAPLLVSAVTRIGLSLASFSCGARLHDVRFVRRLVLGCRAPRGAPRLALVLEVYRSGAGGAVVRRAFLRATVPEDASPADRRSALGAAAEAADRVLLGREGGKLVAVA